MEKDTLQIVREFNRFFAANLNVFDRYALGTAYSLVEGRIVGEIGRDEGCTAIRIAETLKMDKSYLSRILRKLESDGLISKMVSAEDNRKKLLHLTPKGRELFEELERLSDKQAEKMLSGLGSEQVEQILNSMRFIQTLLGGRHDDCTAAAEHTGEDKKE